MRIGVLGPLEVHDDTESEHLLGAAGQRLLLAELVLRSPRFTSSDHLIDLLWRRARPDDAAGALRTRVSRLRSFLVGAGAGGDPIQHGPSGYRLAPGRMTVDAECFERMIRTSRAAAGPAEELEILGEALALWRGDAFEEFLDEQDFLARARGLHELRGGARERSVACLLELRRLPEALALSQELHREDPLREHPLGLLMSALHLSGRAHEALELFEDHRRRLGEELGLDPSKELRALRLAIVRGEPLQGGEAGGAPGSGAGASPVRPAPVAVGSPGDGASLPRQRVRYCRTRDGVRLAYAETGRGPPLVKAANWLNHIEFDWQSPVWRDLFAALSDGRTLIRYDERGIGLSDPDPPVLSLEAWVMDLEAIVDGCGLERFPLLGISQGCAVCIEYAARHPERVTGLVLHGGYAAGWRVDPDCPPAEAARRDASIDLIRHGWGEDTPAYRQMFTQTFIPAGTAAEIEWFNELQRRSATPETAARFMEAFAVIDVRESLSRVRAPTLVIHSTGDQRIPLERGRELARGIPGARFVGLESPNHLILGHEPAFEAWVREASGFLDALDDGPARTGMTRG